MAIENRLTLSELGNVGNLEESTPAAMVRFAELSPLETTISDNFEKVAKFQGLTWKIYSAVGGLGALLTTASVALPLMFIQNQEIAQQVALGGGLIIGGGTALFGIFGYTPLRDHFKFRSQRKKAQKLTDEGYVFVYQLKDSILLPSAVGQVDYLLTRRLSHGESIFHSAWYAIKEQSVSAQVVSLPEIGKYVGETVIVPVQITAVGNYNDMKLSAKGDFSGTLLSVVPLQMRGTIDGRVYTEDVSFRIGDSAGRSIPAYLGYLAPHLKEPLPVELRSYSPITGGISITDKTQLVNFLNEALNNKRQLILLGKLDRAGNFNMEALANPKTKQAYALAVYQRFTPTH